MRLMLVMFFGFGCGSPPKPDPIAPPAKPDLPVAPRSGLPRDVVGRQFVAEMTAMLEASADWSCGCKDDTCKRTATLVVTKWLHDSGVANELDTKLEPTDPCWQARFQVAFRRTNGECSATAAPACPAVPKPAKVAIDPWWEGAAPCPGDSRLERPALPNQKVPWRATCRDGNGELGRFTLWHINGSVLMDGEFDDEHRRNGTWRAYYVHGALAWQRSYRGGAIDGDYLAYYPDGGPKEKGRQLRGAKVGPRSTWDTGGALKVTYFDDDNEVDEASWNATGSKKLCSTECVDRDAPRPAAEYSVSAEKNFTKGTAALAAKQHELAALYFSFIRSRFPYSKYAQLAQQELTTAAVEYARLRGTCTASCGRCGTTCNADAKVTGACKATCADRFPDGASPPPAHAP